MVDDSSRLHVTGVVLGVGAPNDCRDGKKTMCAIVLSDQLGLIRIYPIDAAHQFKVWSRVALSIERHAKDNRHESYRLVTYLVTGCIELPEEKREILNACILKSGGDDPCAYQNKLKKSIALVKLRWGSVSAALDQRTPEIAKDDEEFNWIVTQAKHWNKPYIVWTSEQGVKHTTHLVGREVYEGLRKNPETPWNIFNNMRLNVPDYEAWLLLGNMRDRRNVWVGVHLHRLKKSALPSTACFFTIRDGKPDAWPYCEQETSNVRVVEKQLTLFTT